MVKAGEKLQSLLTVLITWAVLLALFFAYEAYFVKEQEGFLRERGFRVLALISKELNAKFDQARMSAASSVKVMQKEIQAKAHDHNDKIDVDEILNDYLKLYLPATLPPRGEIYPSLKNCWAAKEDDVPKQIPLKSSLEGKGLILRISCYLSGDAKVADHPDLNSAALIFQLDLSDQVRDGIAPMLADFDNILIADSEGRILFQYPETGPTVNDLRDLAPNKDTINTLSVKKDTAGSGSATARVAAAPPGSTAAKDSTQGSATIGESEARWIQSMDQASTFSTVTVGGETYILFSQPAHIATGNFPSASGEQIDLVVCGLRRASGFEEKARAIPYTRLIWAALLAVALFSLSWPFFKLRYMSNTERFSPRDGWYLVFAIVLAAASSMLMFLNLAYGSETEAVADDNARQLAHQIKANVRSELYAAASQLQLLNASPEFPHLSTDHVYPFLGNYLESIYSGTGPPDPCYPYFEIAFWANQKGKQLFKFDVHSVPTPGINVKPNQYFTATISDLKEMIAAGKEQNGDKRALLNCKESPAPDLGVANHIHLQPQPSANTGEFYLDLAFPVPVPDPLVPDVNTRVQVLATKPLSLVDPLVPPGYSFAVIDRKCNVLFDSDSFRNLKENFCQESEDSDELSPWLFSGVDTSIEITYTGRPGRSFLTSLNLPGLVQGQSFLIVFRDPDLKPTLNLAIIVVSSILLGTWFSLLLIVAIVHLLLRGPLQLIYAPKFVWPSPENADRYVQIFVGNGLVFLLFWFSYSELYEGPLLILTLAVAVSTLLFSLLKLCQKNELLFRAALILTGCSASAFLVFNVALMLARNHQKPTEPYQEWMNVFGLLGFFGLVAVLFSVEPNILSRFPRQDSTAVEWIEKKAKKHYSAFYALALLSVINAVVLAPCVGFFKYGHDAVSEISMKRDQIRVSENIIARRNRMQKYYETLQVPGFLKTRLFSPWDRYDTLFFSTKCEPVVLNKCDESKKELDGASSKNPEIINDWIERMIANLTLKFPSNPTGLEMSRLGVASTPAGRDRPWEHIWDEISPRRFSLDWVGDSRLPYFTVSGQYPQWAGLGLSGYFGMGFLWVVLILWLTSLTKQIFLTDVEKTPSFDPVDWKNVNEIGESYLLIGLAKSSKTYKLENMQGLAKSDLRDLRVELDRMKSPYYEKPSCQGSVLILDHFEMNLKDRDWNLRRLHLLESLLYETKCKLVLVSNVDPLYFLTEGDPEILTDSKDPEDATRLLDRWARALSKLKKVRVKDFESSALAGRITQTPNEVNPLLVGWIWAECGGTAFLGEIGIELLDQFETWEDATEDWLVSTVLDRADSYYHVLWSGLTSSERLVLYQLALDGWANPNNKAAIQQLERKRILYRDPMYRIMNKSFRLFIRSAEHADEIAEWEKSERRSTWRALRLVLIAVVVGGAAWLFHSQAAFFQTSVAYVAGIGTLLTAIAGLVGRSKRSAPADSGGAQ